MTPEEQEARRNKDRAVAWPVIRAKAKSRAEALHVMVLHMLGNHCWPTSDDECVQLAEKEIETWYP